MTSTTATRSTPVSAGQRATRTSSAGAAAARLAGQLPTLRAMLEEQRSFRVAQLAELRGQAATAEHRVDTLDAAADEARRQVDLMLAVAARQALADIGEALAAMGAGTYGRCRQCRSWIPPERLEVMPQAALCVPCQRDGEGGR